MKWVGEFIIQLKERKFLDGMKKLALLHDGHTSECKTNIEHRKQYPQSEEWNTSYMTLKQKHGFSYVKGKPQEQLNEK